MDFIRSLIDNSTTGSGTAGNINILADSIIVNFIGATNLVGILVGSQSEAFTFGVSLDILHTWVSDLEAKLESPSGKEITLFSEIGGDGDNFIGTVLRDDASLSINDGSAPFSGTFRPEQPLSTFVREDPIGDWTLVISDGIAHIMKNRRR